MAEEPKKRQRRIPFTSEEVAQLIAIKKWREHNRLTKFRKTHRYRILNLFNVFCFFVYFELLFCYIGPCHYQTHYSYKVLPQYGHEYDEKLNPSIAVLQIISVNEVVYQFIVNDFIKVPQQRMRFVVGKDFLLQKEMKGSLDNSSRTYRLFSASPVLLLCFLMGLVSFGSFVYNLNESEHSLIALSVLNALTFLGILLI